MPTVAVFFGGVSSESEISVITGMFAVNLLRGTQYAVVPVYLPPEGGMVTGNFRGVEDFSSRPALKCTPVAPEGRKLVRADRRRKPVAVIDVALNCCHGGMGEDGTLAALLAWHGVPSASPAAAPCAAFMDKTTAKIFAAGLGIPVAPSVTIMETAWKTRAEDVLAQAEENPGYPVVVKPARLGSSIGLTVAHGEEELKGALALAFTLDRLALVERYHPGRRDVNCAACRLGGEVNVSPCEEVFSGGEVLSFEEKYERGRGSDFPARLPPAVAEHIRVLTRTLYEAFGMRGAVRADFFVIGEEVFFNELNIVPGSLASRFFADSLAGVRAFFTALLDEAIAASVPEKPVLHTGILSQNIFSGAKGCKRRGNLL